MEQFELGLAKLVQELSKLEQGLAVLRQVLFKQALAKLEQVWFILEQAKLRQD
jgi:hypothetical protein